jgi:hypothetical protein
MFYTNLRDNISALSIISASFSEETNNNSFGDKQAKDIICSFNLALNSMNDEIEIFKKSQETNNLNSKSYTKSANQQLTQMKIKLLEMMKVEENGSETIRLLREELQIFNNIANINGQQKNYLEYVSLTSK